MVASLIKLESVELAGQMPPPISHRAAAVLIGRGCRQIFKGQQLWLAAAQQFATRFGILPSQMLRLSVCSWTMTGPLANNAFVPVYALPRAPLVS